MAQLPFSANLNAAFYPFLSRWQGRTVIVSGKDEFYVSKLTTNEPNNPVNEGKAQAYYTENVMPSANGMQSIGYLDQLAGITNAVDFNDLFLLRDSNENKYLLSPANGKNYVYNPNFGGWSTLAGPVAPLVTVAYINGFTYIFYSGVGCYQYNATTNTLDPVALIGVTASLLNGICASSGYLIAWDGFSVYRSKPASILDFTPDASQGSGSSIPQDLKGQIVACLPIFAGFLIYTAKNVVAASYSQNIRYPFIYKEVPGSAGIQNISQVSWQENVGSHYAWTQVGLMSITKTTATSVFNPVTDFLTCGILETFDPATISLVETILSGPLQVRVSMVAQSWLVISYGIDSYTHALIYDLNYKRWGKLRIDHACAFELNLPNLSGILGWSDLGTYSWGDLSSSSWSDFSTQMQTFEQPNTGLAFLQIDGSVVTVDFTSTSTNHDGVAFLGKYQYIRDRWLSAQEINFECVNASSNFNLYLAETLDGKNLEVPTLLPVQKNRGLYRKYNSSVQGENLTLIPFGTFHLVCLDIQFKIESRR